MFMMHYGKKIFGALPRSQLFFSSALSSKLFLQLLPVCTQHLLHAAVGAAECTRATPPCNSSCLPNKVLVAPTCLILAGEHVLDFLHIILICPHSAA